MKDGGPAFPFEYDGPGVWEGQRERTCHPGMTLRQWFAGMALSNPALCTGIVSDTQLTVWFGDRTNISKGEIAAKQAAGYADAMIEEEGKGHG